MTHRLGSRLGHIADLACGLHAMESELEPVNARAYFALAVGLSRALSDLPDAALLPVLAELPGPVRPVLVEALAARQFETRLRWRGAGGAACAAEAQALYARLDAVWRARRSRRGG